MEKQLANWIYYEDGHTFYCSDCIEKRLEEIENNKEFSEDIDYDDGDTCGYMQDYADSEEEVECCECGAPLYSQCDYFDGYQNSKQIVFCKYGEKE